MTQIAINDNIINFVTLNHINMYALYDPNSTTLKRVIDTFYSNYSFRNLDNGNNNIRIYSDALDRYITDADMNKPMSEFKFNTLTKFNLRHHYEYGIDDFDPELVKKLHDKIKYGYIIFCKTLTGKTLEIRVCSDLTVCELKHLIYELEKIPIAQQRIIAHGKQLEDNRTLADYNIQSETTIHLIQRLRGGMYDETSGKNGNYKPLQEILFAVPPDLKKN